MRSTIRTLLVALAAIISLVCVPTVRADDDTDALPTVTGEIVGAYRELSVIEIETEVEGSEAVETVTIVGFPFNNLEAQLGTTIAEGNCVTVEYTEKELLCSGEIVKKWESLKAWCEMCPVNLDRTAPEECVNVVDDPLTRDPQPQQSSKGPNP